MELERLASVVESILFAADKPISIARLIEVFGETAPSEGDFNEALFLIKQRTETPQCGFQLREAQGGFHLVTKPENVEWVQKFLETKPFRLGRSSLEVLAIIAYRQPITRAEIDQVRGIDSSHLLRTLMERGLVKMTGKADAPGRPVQYGTTPKFLETVGLNTMNDLPPLSELEELQGDTKDPLKSLEEGLDRLIQEEPETALATAEQDQKGLEELSYLIDSARQGSKEVYASPAHAEVAESNEQAANSLQGASKFRKKKETNVPEEILTAEETIIEIPILESNPEDELVN
jgi:segregation and condensation protein B